MRSIKRITIGIAAGAAVVAMTSTMAFAEGGFTTSVTQVQPGFDSRVWQDHGSDSNSTIIKLTNCKVNKGGYAPSASSVKTVGITLTHNAAILKTITQKCGSYNFGVRGGDSGPSGEGGYSFTIASINGVTTPASHANEGTFLNADVSVAF